MSQTRSKLTFEVAETLPDARPGPRDSEAYRAYKAAVNSPTGIVEVKGDPAEVKRFYLSMVQWRRRQREANALSKPVTVRKAGDRVFVSVSEDQTPEPDQKPTHELTRTAPIAAKRK